MHYSEFVAYESDWKTTNLRRGQLIDKKVRRTITKDETLELVNLQAYAEYHIEKVSPRPTQLLEELENILHEMRPS